MKKTNKMATLVLASTMGLSFLVPLKSEAVVGLIMLAAGSPTGVVVAEVGVGLMGSGLAAGVALDLAADAGYGYGPGVGRLVAEMSFWPGVFVLDRTITQVPQISVDQLVENGYTLSKAQQIKQESDSFNSILTARKQALLITSNETAANIRDGLRNIAQEVGTSVSEDFLEIQSKRLELASQK